MKYRVEFDGSLRVLDLSEKERSIIQNVINEFRVKDNQAPQMAKKINEDIKNNYLKFETLVQFSKWCDTAKRYKNPMSYARELCCALFGEGELIPRLCKGTRVLSIFVEKYKIFILKLMKKGIILNCFEVFCHNEKGFLGTIRFDLTHSS